jgi:hypothetical protein
MAMACDFVLPEEHGWLRDWAMGGLDRATDTQRVPSTLTVAVAIDAQGPRL